MVYLNSISVNERISNSNDGKEVYAYMPTLERLKAVGGDAEGSKMVHSAAFWI
jgi:hypothetical protein